MKIVMDKRLGQAETERRRLEQELMTTRTSSFNGSMISLDSNSDDSGGSPSPNPGTSTDIPPPTGEKLLLPQADYLSDLNRFVKEIVPLRVQFVINSCKWYVKVQGSCNFNKYSQQNYEHFLYYKTWSFGTVSLITPRFFFSLLRVNFENLRTCTSFGSTLEIFEDFRTTLEIFERLSINFGKKRN